jgi:hypothetical protein
MGKIISIDQFPVEDRRIRPSGPSHERGNVETTADPQITELIEEEIIFRGGHVECMGSDRIPKRVLHLNSNCEKTSQTVEWFCSVVSTAGLSRQVPATVDIRT